MKGNHKWADGTSLSSGASSITSDPIAGTPLAYYTFTDLGAVGTGGTLPTGINNAAALSDVLTAPTGTVAANGSVQAAGSAVAGTFDYNYSNTGTVADLQDAFVYDATFHDLGVLPPGSFTGPSRAAATAINDSGTVTGCDIFEPPDQTHAFRHRNWPPHSGG